MSAGQARPRVRWVHRGCGGLVTFTVAGGTCAECGAGPLPPAEYLADPAGPVPAPYWQADAPPAQECLALEFPSPPDC